MTVPEEPGVYRFRSLETATFFELVDGLNGGDIHVEGAANYGAFTEDIFPIDSEPEAVAQFLKDRGFPDSAHEYVRDLRERLQREVLSVERAVGTTGAAERAILVPRGAFALRSRIGNVAAS